MNKQSSRSATSMGAPAGRASFARLVSSLILALSALAGLLSPPGRGDGGGGLPPLRTAQAAGGSWTQTEWTTPNSTLGVVSSGTNQYFRPGSVSSYGQLVGTFGVCAGAGAWCQGPGEAAGGQTLRLAGNHKSDAANPHSSDLNGDGVSELLFAGYGSGGQTLIYWGQGTPSSPSWNASTYTNLPSGAVGLIVADLNGDGLPEVISSNYSSTDQYVYWGQAGGTYGVQYSAGARTVLNIGSTVGVAAADLNRDGRPELIFGLVSGNSYIYWGQAGGTYGVQYSAGARTALPTSFGASPAVADLNRDGLPEVIFTNYSGSYTYVYWGQAGGTYGVQYSTSARTDLSTGYNGHNVSAADLNGDGRPEVIITPASNTSYIYWGQAGGGFSAQYTALPHGGNYGYYLKSSVADINNDGQRDVVLFISNYVRIFWGPLPTSGTATNYWQISLNNVSYGRGLSLSDLNNDGRVDLLISQESSGLGHLHLHTGNNTAPYSATPSFALPDGGYSTCAYASFGPGRGNFADWSGHPRPVYGTAFPNFGVLESMVMDSGQNGTAWHTVHATTSITSGTGITLFVAASDNLSALSNPTWVQVGAMGNGSWTGTMSGVSGRYARYRLVLWRDHTTEASPALQQITFNYGLLPGSFNKSTPANAASGVATSPTLSWTGAADATYYELCYDTSVNGACNGTWQNVNGTSQALSGLAPGATYEWQVRACNLAGCNGGADNGVWWTFTTATGPAGFSKASPAHNSSGHPTSLTLSWNSTSGQGAVSYEYCVNTTPSCSTWTNIGAATNVNVSDLSPGTTYYWQVRACDANGCTQANAGSFWSFQTAQTVGSFNKLAPGNGAVNVNTNTAQLQWAEASGSGVTYAVCVGTAVNNCDVLGGGPGQYAGVGANQFRILSDLGLQPNTTYYWQVLATNGVYTTYANGSAFSFWSFTTLPAAPNSTGFNKQAPAFNATNVPTSNITFRWTPASGAVSYTVCVGAFVGDCSYSATSTASSAVLPGPLPAGATLVWQVAAHNAAGTVGADNGAWWPLSTVPNAPTTFTKFAPANGAAGQPAGVNLTWQDTPDETYYQVCVGTSPGTCTFANVTTTANTTSYALTGLDYGTTYFWQVSACNAGGCTPANNGIAWSFSTQNPPLPGPFGKTGPANGATGMPANASAVLLQWTASEQADGYEVCFGTNAGSCDLTGGGYQDVGNVLGRYVNQLGVALQPASTYWWQVRAYNNLTATRTFANNGVAFYFTTAAAGGPGSFSKDAPLNGASNLPTATVALRWLPASGATSYEVCAGTAANSCDAMPGNTWLNVGSARAYTLTNLQVGTTYHWQVRAINAGGATAANGGAWWAFTTRSVPPPEAFTKAGPPHLATGVPTATAVLSWYVSTGATAYEVCVGSAPGLCEASGGWVNVGNVTQWTPPALNTATTYWWQARALGGGLPVQADGGQWWAFTTVPEGPAAFSKRTPVQGASGQPASGLALRWFSAPNATGYEVCLGTQAGLCDVSGGWQANGDTEWVVPGALQPATTYWWQVRAVNAGGQTQADGGQWWYFTTAAAGGAPAAFGKRAPVNNAAAQAVNLTLSWNPAGGATGYEVCVGALPGDCSKTGGWASVGGTSYALSGLSHATTYWWQVRAVNSSGQTLADGGAWWRFTTANAPGSPLGAFEKIAPVHLATGVPTATATLSWTASAGAAGYEVCVGSGPGFCEVTGGWLNVGNVTQWAPAGLSAATTYWWQVRARDGAGSQVQADGGQWWAFTTMADPPLAPGAFSKQTPVQGASGRPVGGLQLSWVAANRATGYQVCIGTQAGLCDVTGSWVSVGNVTNWPVGAALQPATTYWWQVRAVNSSGQVQADGGQWWYFTTAAAGGAPAAFGKLLPANNASGQPLNPTLSWDDANDATGYQVCVGLLPGDCSKTGGWVSVGGTGYALSGLSHATTYWWQVRAVNAGGQTQADGGAWWRFTTLNAPGSPIGAFGKSAPAREAIGVPTNATLSWDAAANAARYTVCVGTQPGLCDVMNNIETTGTSLALAGAQPGRTYWWQVTAHDGNGALRVADEGAWWAFTTANNLLSGPGGFNKSSPVSGTVVANPIVLTWGTSGGAIRYQVCLGRAIGLCDVLNNAIASSGESWVLPAGSYWWQVTAVDAEGDTTQADGGIWWPLTVQRAADNVNTGGATGTRKDVTPTVARMGELVSYTIVVSNSGSAAVTVQVTDTLPVSATLVSATPGYVQSGQTLVWSNVVVPAGGAVVLTTTVRAGSGPLPGGYTLLNSVTVGTADGEFTRSAPPVQVEPLRAFVPIVMRP